MKRAEYLNPHSHSVKLVGPDGRLETIPAKTRVVRSEWFNRYVPKHLRFIRYMEESTGRSIRRVTRSQFRSRKPVVNPRVVQAKDSPRTYRNQTVRPNRTINSPRARGPQRSRQRLTRVRNTSARHAGGGRVVGRAAPQFKAHFAQVSSNSVVPISNNIGVGILSYNRIGSLQRLVDSIRKFTNLQRTTVFISDESTTLTKDQIAWLDSLTDFVVLRGPRLGIAGNANRLLRCLSRFKHKILLNDDVEVLGSGWEEFYPRAMDSTGLHHLCFREPGVYGAKDRGEASQKGGLKVLTVHEKPHGAIMALDHAAFEAVGFMDEGFGIYGMEHVDWGERVAKKFGQPGFHDVVGSEGYFKIHSDGSAVEDRIAHFGRARARYQEVSGKRVHVNASAKSVVPAMTVVVPFREGGRMADMTTVIANLKAMRYPDLDIVLVEQDQSSKVSPQAIEPVRHLFVPNATAGQHFNKAAAFNKGVASAKHDKLILHDADIIVTEGYARAVSDALDKFEGCHLGGKVYYLTQQGTDRVNVTHSLPGTDDCNRVVSYFEGGSIACTRGAYRKAGGFDEDYIGYGMEDCCFFERVKTLTNFHDNRVFNFFHLNHGRTQGWEERHKHNKNLFVQKRKHHQTLQKYAAWLRTRLGS